MRSDPISRSTSPSCSWDAMRAVRQPEREPHARPRVVRQQGGQRQAQHGRRQVAGGDLERALRRRRVERGLPPDDAGKLVERRPHGRGEIEGARRRRHAASVVGGQQQWIVEQLAQARELAGHGRLAQVQALGRAGHVRFRQQGVERDEQVQVEGAQIVHATIIAHDYCP